MSIGFDCRLSWIKMRNCGILDFRGRGVFFCAVLLIVEVL